MGRSKLFTINYFFYFFLFYLVFLENLFSLITQCIYHYLLKELKLEYSFILLIINKLHIKKVLRSYWFGVKTTHHFF